jgi:hypothetical protein
MERLGNQSLMKNFAAIYYQNMSDWGKQDRAKTRNIHVTNIL